MEAGDLRGLRVRRFDPVLWGGGLDVFIFGSCVGGLDMMRGFWGSREVIVGATRAMPDSSAM